MNMRISARLDEEHCNKLEHLRHQKKLSVSEIVKQAIDLMYAQQISESRNKTKSLLASDFIACGSGPLDLSTNYKAYLNQTLENKHDFNG